MKPSLRDAYVRLDRGREHLAELTQLAGEIVAAQTRDTIVEVTPDQWVNAGEAEHVMKVTSGQVPIPDRCSVLTGDTANSLRSALDYLVGQLAHLDSGARTSHTQFPIEPTAESFCKRRRTSLRGLSAGHVGALEQLQPYRGCDWTSPLQRLSNRDKHDALVVVAHDYLVTVDGGERGCADSILLKVRIRPVLRIALRDGMPLIETLERITAAVTRTLNSFRPEFEHA